MLLDVATDIYPVSVNQNLTLQVVSSLERTSAQGNGDVNGTDTAGKEAWRNGSSGTLADDFDYVMYGKVSRFNSAYGPTLIVHADIQIRRYAVGNRDSLLELWRLVDVVDWFI